MLRRTIVALLAATSIILLVPDIAAARGGGSFGGGHGGFGGGAGGFSRGDIGGGFSAAPMSAGAFRGGPVVGRRVPRRARSRRKSRFPLGNDRAGWRGWSRSARCICGWRTFRPWLLPSSPLLPGIRCFASWPYDYYPDYYSDYYYYENGCYLVNRRVHARHGWRVRPIEICY